MLNSAVLILRLGSNILSPRLAREWAAGSNRKRSKQPASTAPTVKTSTPQPTPTATTNASTNGSSKTPVVY